MRDKLDHQRKRRILSSAYALKNLEGWEYKVADKVERFLKQADKHSTAPLKKGLTPAPEDLTFNYRAFGNFFSLDAIMDIGLSETLGFIDQGSDLCTAETMDGRVYTANYRECLHSTAKAQSGLVWSYAWYPFLAKLSQLISPSYRRMFALNKSWDDIVWRRATQRLARYRAGEKLDDFFSALMQDKNGNPNAMEWGEIVAEISIMMNAGSDTTAVAVNNAMYHLLSNPAALAKLREEIDRVADPAETVLAYDKVRHLPYLRACLDEALRLSPPSTFGLPRRTPAEGAPILGEFIAGDTSVSMSAHVAHRDERVFPEPEAFRPERWLGDDAKELQAAFITFSTGARGCIGRKFSPSSSQSIIDHHPIHPHPHSSSTNQLTPSQATSPTLSKPSSSPASSTASSSPSPLKAGSRRSGSPSTLCPDPCRSRCGVAFPMWRGSWVGRMRRR